jgi:IclR family transcriptional regulator, pca regulon regulatory protein
MKSAKQSRGKKVSKQRETRATFVRSVARALKVISSFGAESPSQTLSQVAAKTKLDRATARRVLLTLVKLRYLRQEDRLFSLTPLILELGFAFLSSLPYWSVANDVLKQLSDSLQVFCLIATTDRDYDHVVVVSSIRPSNTPTFTEFPDVGRRAPTHTVAPGIVLLGELSGAALDRALKASIAGRGKASLSSLRERVIKDKKQGWSSRSVPVENFCEIAVPLVDRQGRIIASMSVLSPLSRIPAEDAVRLYLPTIKRAAEEINKLVAYKSI